MNPIVENVFDGMKQLFSTGLTIRNYRGHTLKPKDIYNPSAVGDLMTNYLGSRYKNMHSTLDVLTNSNQYLPIQGMRLMMFRDYELMDQDPIIHCLSGDTRVSTLEGFFTMTELTEKYKNDEFFEVWAWDKDTSQYVIGQAHHPRQTGIKNVIELHLDNNEVVKCTADHLIMLKDGSYKKAGELTVSDSIMPFLYKNKKYMYIKSKHSAFKPVHRYIYEDIFEHTLTKDDNIHHINKNKYDNRTVNLQKMTATEHSKLHGIDIVSQTIKGEKIKNTKKINSENEKNRIEKIKKWYSNPINKKAQSELMKIIMNVAETKEKISNSIKKLWKDDLYRETALSGLKEWQNSDEGKRFMSAHASKINFERWNGPDNEEYRKKVAKTFSNVVSKLWENPEWKAWKSTHHSETMKLKYKNNPELRLQVRRPVKLNGRYKSFINNDELLLAVSKCNNKSDLKSIDIPIENNRAKYNFITRRLKQCGYSSFDDFKLKYEYSNHKIIKIVDNNEIMPVYDLTVDIFQNFCLEAGIVVSNSALDLYAEETTVKSELGQVLRIQSEDETIRVILENLFYDVLNIEFNLLHWVRTFVKYGDHFLKLNLVEKLGVVDFVQLSPYDVTRVENVNRETGKSETIYKVEGQQYRGVINEYEMVHFRLLTDSNFLPYGKSMIEGGRRIWKQVNLMEDAMLISRIMRAPQKRVFKIEVGNIHPNEIETYMQNVINQMKKVPFIDPQTGDYNLQYNMQNITEDFYLPVRGTESGNSIDTLNGLEYNSIDDINYLKDKLLAALRIPKAFLGFEEAVGSKNLLASEDIRFARTIERIQKVLISELNKIARIHLHMQGYDIEKINSAFSLQLVSPSIIFEQERMELWKSRLELGNSLKESHLFSEDYIYKTIFKFSDEEVEENRKLVIEDMKRQNRLTQILESGNDPVMTDAYVTTSGAVVDPNDPSIVKSDGMTPPGQIPKGQKGYQPTNPVARQENVADSDTNYNSPFKPGTGAEEMRGSNKLDKKNGTETRGGSPLAVEEKEISLEDDELFSKMNVINEDIFVLSNKLKNIL